MAHEADGLAVCADHLDVTHHPSHVIAIYRRSPVTSIDCCLETPECVVEVDEDGAVTLVPQLSPLLAVLTSTTCPGYEDANHGTQEDPDASVT